MKKDTADWGVDSVELAKKTSEINRQLAFAGIAIIWIFKNPDGAKQIIPDSLITPLFLFVLLLGIDLIHYFFGAVSWYIFYQINQRKVNTGKLKGDADIDGPFWIDYTATGLFAVKVILNIIAYVELGKFLLPKL